jgi:hypothetical protein
MDDSTRHTHTPTDDSGGGGGDGFLLLLIGLFIIGAIAGVLYSLIFILP